MEDFSLLQKEIDVKSPSLKVTAVDVFGKTLLLAAASYFEKKITSILVDEVERRSPSDVLIIEFFKNKALSRNYHTFFAWESKNANAFFALFGDGFKDYMKDCCNNDEDLRTSIRAFLELGNDRNRLVHQNFGEFVMEKNVEEVYDLYCKAIRFVERIPVCMKNFVAEQEKGA